MRKIYLFLGLLSLAILMGCKENPLGPLSHDTEAPGKLEIVSVTPINGGFKVKFKSPIDNDLLMIKGEYDLVGGKKGEVSVSYFSNELTISGFGDTAERTIRLFAVDRSGNISAPVEFTSAPLIAPVRLVQNSMNIGADFGGARFTWENLAEAAISIQFFAEDSITHKLKLVNTVYTSQMKSKFTIRNMPSRPTAFAAVIRDRWDNVSDTIKPSGKLTPLFEQKLDKTKMRKIILDSDTRWDAWGFTYEGLIDDNFTTSAHTQGDHPWPQIFSIDLGARVKLSRFRVYQRGPENTGFLYSHGNPKRYDVYGAAELPADPNDLSQWIKLREECVSVKPSGKDGMTDEDLAHALNGDEFEFDQTTYPAEIRYFRFVVWETWDGAGFIDFNELTWWGNVIQTYN